MWDSGELLNLFSQILGPAIRAFKLSHDFMLSIFWYFESMKELSDNITQKDICQTSNQRNLLDLLCISSEPTWGPAPEAEEFLDSFLANITGPQ